VSAFLDMGGVYETGSKLQFYGQDGVTPQSYRLTEWSDIRRSVGVAVQWLAPLGLFRFSLGVPLNRHRDNYPYSYGDQTEVFQFSIGQAF